VVTKNISYVTNSNSFSKAKCFKKVTFQKGYHIILWKTMQAFNYSKLYVCQGEFRKKSKNVMPK
jgi:hypothetical protein